MPATKNGQPLFANRGMFDVLGADIADVEEEEEDGVQDEPSPTESNKDGATVISKAEKKRRAKAARLAQAEAEKKQKAEQAAAKVHVPTEDGAPSYAEAAKPADTSEAKESAPENASKPAVSSTSQFNGSARGNSPAAPKTPSVPSNPVEKATASSSANSTAPASQSAVQAPTKESPASKTPSSEARVPSEPKFSPELPKSLPTPEALPSNRKRKTPGDFTPTGPRDVTTATSKIGVKFEDGVAPGEGKEGEKTMPKKNQNVVERTVWTFIMIFGFIGLLCLGHPYMIMLVLLCQTLVYKEVTALFDLRDQGSKKIADGDRWSKSLNWYFFVVANYFLYGESIIYYFKHIVFVDAYFLPFARNHRFISFMLYVVGFVGFVANLQRQYLRQQFALFCWVHITLFLIVVSSHFIVNSILEGLIWFFVPASLVICNDVMAYICGKLFGRTPLIKLSPKKTVEGFVGAFICTLIFGWAWGTFFMRFAYMICPARDLGANILSHIQCKPNPVFIWREYHLTGAIRQIMQTMLGREPPAIPYAPFQLHVLAMATFASLVAPFGGFFASGFKRAFNIKDFGHSIPGHGGMTDRMDCQFMMGMFSYVYYSSLIRIQSVSVGSVMQTIATSLTAEEQLELLADLRRFLQGQGIKP